VGPSQTGRALIGRARRKGARRAAKASSSRRAKAERTDKEPYVTWSLRLPISIHVALKRLAQEQGRSTTKQVEMLVRKAIADEPKRAMFDEPSSPRTGRPETDKALLD
jgi:hypothetical protein